MNKSRDSNPCGGPGRHLRAFPRLGARADSALISALPNLRAEKRIALTYQAAIELPPELPVRPGALG